MLRCITGFDHFNVTVYKMKPSPPHPSFEYSSYCDVSLHTTPRHNELRLHVMTKDCVILLVAPIVSVYT